MIGKSLVFPFVFHQGRLKNGATCRPTVGGRENRKKKKSRADVFGYLSFLNVPTTLLVLKELCHEIQPN